MMTQADEQRSFLSAWGISLAVHSMAVVLGLAFLTQITPVVKEEIFKWEVALVQATRPEPMPKQVEPVAKPAPAVKPRPEPVVQRTEPRQPMQMVQPVMESVKPIEPKVEPVPVIEAKEPEPVAHAEPVVASAPTPAYEPTAYATPVPSAQQDSPSPSTSHGSDTAPAVEDAPMQAAKSIEPVSDAKVDNRWLAESLWKRVAELKRYPNSARMNGQEGKVLLKAVIRSNGQLVEVSIQKSSGHSILDAAAMETVKLACPLHMKHAIGKPLITVSLPIVYSLAN
ncbi:MAG: energy transducer TonB [Nitrospira sp.]|nr:energy transducer TonB [Nitrospira sp.]